MPTKDRFRLLSLNINCRGRALPKRRAEGLDRVLMDLAPDVVVFTEYAPNMKGDDADFVNTKSDVVQACFARMGWSTPLVSAYPKKNRVLIASRYRLHPRDVTGPAGIPSIYLQAWIPELGIELAGFRPVIDTILGSERAELTSEALAASGDVGLQIRWLSAGPAETLRTCSSLITGDFNAAFSYPSKSKERERGSPHLRQMLTDGWISVEPVDSTETSFPAIGGCTRIDHTFVSPGCEWRVAVSRYVNSTEGVLESEWPSDHKGQMMDFVRETRDGGART